MITNKFNIFFKKNEYSKFLWEYYQFVQTINDFIKYFKFNMVVCYHQNKNGSLFVNNYFL